MLFMTGWLLAASIMDIRTRRVPVWMLAFGGGLAALAAWRQGAAVPEAVMGMLPGVLLLLTALATKKAGYGDGVVLCMFGAVLGREKGMLLFGISLFLLSLYALTLLALRKAGKNTRIPFLPFLAAGWIAVIHL